MGIVEGWWVLFAFFFSFPSGFPLVYSQYTFGSLLFPFLIFEYIYAFTYQKKKVTFAGKLSQMHPRAIRCSMLNIF